MELAIGISALYPKLLCSVGVIMVQFGMRKISLFFIVIVVLLSPLAVSASQPFFVPKGSLVYDVVRNGEIIGEQRVDFKNGDKNLIVNTSSNIRIDLFGIPIYSFDQTTEEVWQDGIMVSYKADAVDGGDKKDLKLQRIGNSLVGTYNGKKRTIPGNIISSVLWRVDATKSKILLDAVNGKMKDTNVEKVGEEMIDVGGKPVKASHFVFTGEFKREAWYDELGHMVKAILVARDGSKVTQLLKAIPE